MPTHPTTSTRRRLARAAAAGLLLATVGAPLARPAFAADGDKPAPAKGAERPARTELDPEMLKWYAKLFVFGEEETGNWSLRVYDKDAERATVRYTELWKLDPEAKRWLKIDEGAAPVKIVPPNEKPPNSPADSQVVGELPIKQDQFGLYWVKWRVNDRTDGATMTRIGPGLVGKAVQEAKEHPPKVPEGMIAQVVPLSLNKAELMVIPDPRYNTGGPVKKPAGKK